MLYQLSDPQRPTGSGAGCGLYDENGSGDSGGIAKRMNEYVFEICFNPESQDGNIFYFLDHCLSHLSSGFFSGGNEDGYLATRQGLPGSFDPREMGKFWRRHREFILQQEPKKSDRRVITMNYIASYRDDLDKVFTVLDQLENDAF